MPSKYKIHQGEDVVAQYPSPSQPPALGVTTPSTTITNGPTPSHAPELMPSAPNFWNMLPSGGYFAGTFIYYPQGAPFSAHLSARAITSTPGAAPETSAAEDPAADAPAAESARAIEKLDAACFTCGDKAEDMQTVKGVGYMCSKCLFYNSTRG